MARVDTRTTDVDNVRMGPIAVFTLLAVVSLATLAVLSISTANASLGLAQRRADATTQLYLKESSAQAFVAALDAGLQEGAAPEAATSAAREEALAAAGEQGALTVQASCDAGRYEASFSTEDGRQLDITLRYGTDGTLHIDQWRMTTVVNDEPTLGDLLGSTS